MPEPGIYDGTIGKTNLILVINAKHELHATGYFIHNRKNVMEEKHNITFEVINNKLKIMSDEYWGELQGKISSSKITGTLRITDRKFRLFFWKNRLSINFKRRTEFNLASSKRYQEEIFSKIQFQEDIKYGEAQGYWTKTPYLDDPYIEILAKGMVNLLKGEKEQDLMLDIYLPKGDQQKIRPLLLLIHGGAFYIGNKQSPTEQLMAYHFARMGYVVASMDYRMGFKLGSDDIEQSGYKAIQDAHAALRFLSSKSKQLGFDTKQIYLAGTSAGAMASLNLAFLDNDERPQSTYHANKNRDLGNIEVSGNPFTNSFEIKAVTNLWGAVSDTSIIDPDERIPVLSIHGNKDDIVPADHSFPFRNTLKINQLVLNQIYGSIPIHQRLNHLGIENKLIILEGKGHEPQLENFKRVNSTLDMIIDEMTTFMYHQTITPVELFDSVYTVSVNKGLQPLVLPVKESEICYFEVEGGLKISDHPGETTVIWIKNNPHTSITFYTSNKFAAWSKDSIAVKFLP